MAGGSVVGHLLAGQRLGAQRFTVDATGQAAEDMNHHADLDLRSARVDVRLTSGYGAGGVTQTDVELARRVTDIAAAAGAELECSSITLVEFGLDTPDHEKIGPFWAAVLDGKRPWQPVERWSAARSWPIRTATRSACAPRSRTIRSHHQEQLTRPTSDPPVEASTLAVLLNPSTA